MVVFASALEVANALVITYFGTEVLLKDQLRYERNTHTQGRERSTYLKRLRWGAGALLAGANLVHFVSKFFTLSNDDDSSSTKDSFQFHVPSYLVLFLVVSTFTALLWWDVHRVRKDVSIGTFAKEIFKSLIESLLILPLVSVAVALCFLVLIGVLDFLRVSTAWLNSPIYFGILYGPFSTIYFFTKKRCITNKGQILPL